MGAPPIVFAQEVQVLPWLKTDLEDLTLFERGKLLQFLTEVDRLAPVRLKQSVESPLSLIFSAPLNEEERLPDPCEVTVPFALGHSQFSKKAIVMSRLLRREILKGPDLATRFSCGHQNYYRFAQAVLLHELTHFFDRSDHGGHGTQKLSDSKQFKYMTGWDLQGLVIRHWTQSNLLTSRSPDPYEFKSPKEALAVSAIAVQDSKTAVIENSENSFKAHKELIEQALEAFADIRGQIQNSTQNALEFRKAILEHAL